jgi:hypothetical protein
VDTQHYAATAKPRPAWPAAKVLLFDDLSTLLAGTPAGSGQAIVAGRHRYLSQRPCPGPAVAALAQRAAMNKPAVRVPRRAGRPLHL